MSVSFFIFISVVALASNLLFHKVIDWALARGKEVPPDGDAEMDAMVPSDALSGLSAKQRSIRDDLLKSSQETSSDDDDFKNFIVYGIFFAASAFFVLLPMWALGQRAADMLNVSSTHEEVSGSMNGFSTLIVGLILIPRMWKMLLNFRIEFAKGASIRVQKQFYEASRPFKCAKCDGRFCVKSWESDVKLVTAVPRHSTSYRDDGMNRIITEETWTEARYTLNSNRLCELCGFNTVREENRTRNENRTKSVRKIPRW